MTCAVFLTRLLALLVAGLAIALVLRLAGGARWFGFYGPALAVLAVLPFAHRLIANRLAEHGRRRRLAWAVSLPLGLMAAGQIGYWAAFFRGSANAAIQLGIVRVMARDWLGAWLPALGLALVLLLVFGLWRLAADPSAQLFKEAGGDFG